MTYTLQNYFAQVIWKCLFKQSSRDHGTLGYFQSLLNRVTATNDPKKCVYATIDFLTTTVKGHILACALEMLGVSKLDSNFSSHQVSTRLLKMTNCYFFAN